MMIQRVYKGICGIERDEAEARLRALGIASRWWKGVVSPDEVLAQLTDAALMRHLNDYDAFRAGHPVHFHDRRQRRPRR